MTRWATSVVMAPQQKSTSRIVIGRGFPSPRIAQRTGASVGLISGGEVAVELGDHRPVGREEYIARRQVVSTESCVVGTPKTVKLVLASARRQR